jgi:uroporphyrinogen-III synthase
VLPDELRKMGAQVDVIEAYETTVPADSGQKLHAVFAQPETRPNLVTFTSSSTASNFLALLGDKVQTLVRGVRLASIGPITSDTLRQAGFEPDIEATEYTMQGLVEAITQFADSK